MAEKLHIQVPLAEALSKAGRDDDHRRLADATLIRVGWSANNKFYGAQVLREAVSKGVFADGSLGFVDHPEGRRKFGRSLRDVGAIYSNVRFTEGRVAADLEFIGRDAPWLYDLAAKHPELVGLSIWGGGRTKTGTIDGRKGRIVEAISKLDSVDLVASPAAGGKIEKLREGLMEVIALGEAKLDELHKERPDLVEAVEADYAKAHPPKTDRDDETLSEAITARANAEAELKVVKSQVALVEGEIKRLKQKNEELAEAAAKAETAKVLDEQLGEAKLPEASEKRLRESLAEETDPEKIAEAVKAEAAYVKALLGGGKPRDMGGQSGKTDDLAEAQSAMDNIFGIEDDKPGGEKSGD